MNLRIADGAGLVAFLHGVISESGTTLLSVGRYAVVDMDGRLFYHAADPITVGGPFPSLVALVRSEGLRRHHVPGLSSQDPPLLEIFEWAGTFFRMAGDEEGHVSIHASLEEPSGAR